MNTKKTQKPEKSEEKESLHKTYNIPQSLVKINLFTIGITNATQKEVLEYIKNMFQKTQKKLVITTPNPEIIMLAQKNKRLKKALNEANLALPDGVGLLWASRFLGKPLQARIIGTDFMEILCKESRDWPITIGFLGGRPGVAEKTSECLQQKYPGLKVGFAGEKLETGSLMPLDILFVAYGAPKQEIWMMDNISTLPVRMMMGVGGAFDQIVDRSLRPPKFIHQIGVGWLYRLIREPWRIKRQLTLIEFIFLVLRERFL